MSAMRARATTQYCRRTGNCARVLARAAPITNERRLSEIFEIVLGLLGTAHGRPQSRAHKIIPSTYFKHTKRQPTDFRR